MPLFGGEFKRRLKCEVVDSEDDTPRLVCKLYDIDEEGNVVRIAGQAVVVKTENGLIFEEIDIEAGTIEDFKKLIAQTLKPNKPAKV